MVDRDLVTRKLLLIGTDLEILRALADKTREHFIESDYDELVAERLLERVIGRMIDINYHLIVESGQAPPKDYHGSFMDLPKLGVVSQDFASRLAAAAGLRNRIVHDYDVIDPEKIHDAMLRAISDVPEYARRVEAYVDSEQPRGVD